MLDQPGHLRAAAGAAGGDGGLAPQTRLYRSFFLDELGQDYVRTARAKGMTESMVLFKHVLRNAMIPILTNVGLALPGIFVGSFLIEVFFSIPGLGREVLLAVNRSDYPGDPGGDGLPGGADDADQPADRPAVQAGRPAGGAEMSARAACAAGALDDSAAETASRRRLARRLAALRAPTASAWSSLVDRARPSCVLIAAVRRWAWWRATGRRGRRAQRAAHLPRAAPAEATGAIEVPKGPNVDLSDDRPAGAALRGMGRARREVQDRRRPPRPRRCRSAPTGSAATCWPRPSRAPRSRSSSACWRRWSPRCIGTVLGALRPASSAARSATCWSGSTTSSSRSPASC